jgi:NitT/TauT family transport system permease protein
MPTDTHALAGDEAAAARGETRHDRALAGLDALELAVPTAPSRLAASWNATWPKLLAVAIFVGAWQIVVWTHWRPSYVLPGPVTTFKAFVNDRSVLAEATFNTLKRGVLGFSLAVVIGSAVGLAAASSRILRSGIGSMITGLQTMPSIAWFPLAIVLFKLTNAAVFFVVVLGAAPSIANGLLNGVDNIPPILLRAGRVLGAKGWSRLRYIVVPAALPTFAGGMKQGWSFAWRSLLAGELLVLIPGVTALGQTLEAARDQTAYADMMATMVAIFLVGVLIDALVFSKLDRTIRRRYGLIDTAT